MVKCVSIVLISLSLVQAQDTVRPFVKAAQRAEAAGDTLNAFFLYGRAAASEPANSLLALQGKSLGARLMREAATVYGMDPALDPATRMANRIVTEELSPTDVIESDAALAPPRLAASTERKLFDLRGTARPVIEEVARAFGIKTVFEQDFPASSALVFHTGELTRDEAFRSIEAATNTFFVPVRDDTILVFPDTTDKRNSNVPVMAIAIPIPQRMNVQEAQELASGVQQIIELRHIAVDAGRRVSFMRDQEYKIRAARRLIGDLARYRAQV